MIEFVPTEIIRLENHPELNERWVQEILANDPSVLGLGELILKDKERNQLGRGRLDLLFRELEGDRRFEVEVQLGKTDESHIIRTIEYWDNERKLYPQYEHCAVIVAEDITSRFLNVIGLFNGSIPLVAIQMKALKIGGMITLVFTTVMDAFRRGLVDEDEEVQAVTDRSYWEDRGSVQTVAMADDMLALIQSFAPGFQLKYNRYYIGLSQDGQPNNFVIFYAKKANLNVEIRLEFSEETQKHLEDAGLDLMGYDKKWRKCRLRLAKEDTKKHKDILLALLKEAWEYNQK